MFFLRKEYFDLVVPPKHTGLLKPLNVKRFKRGSLHREHCGVAQKNLIRERAIVKDL